jgi:hypothetical protein
VPEIFLDGPHQFAGKEVIVVSGIGHRDPLWRKGQAGNGFVWIQ